MEEEVRDGVTIRVATYALDNPRGRKQLTKLAAEIIEYYQEFLGPFPFPEFNILEINDVRFRPGAAREPCSSPRRPSIRSSAT